MATLVASKIPFASFFYNLTLTLSPFWEESKGMSGGGEMEEYDGEMKKPMRGLFASAEVIQLCGPKLGKGTCFQLAEIDSSSILSWETCLCIN